MADLVDRAVEIAGELADVARSSETLSAKGCYALDLLSAVIPHDAMALCMWDPFSQRHVAIGVRDYPEHVVTFLNTSYIADDPIYHHMEQQNIGALRWRDYQGYRDSESVRNIFKPTGFDEGLTTRLVSSDGHYTGAFHLSSVTDNHPSDESRALINGLRRTLAHLTDVSFAPRQFAVQIADGSDAWLLDRNGTALNVIGEMQLPPQVSSKLTRLEGLRHRGFRWQHEGEWHTVRTFPMDAMGALLVVWKPEPLPFRISDRELDVLSLLACGLSNSAIAGVLVLSTRTVVHHVEHIMQKLNVKSRGGCARIAFECGLSRLEDLGRV